MERTGLVSFTFQVTCLTLCVASIWMPGSPFDPEALFGSHPDHVTSNSTSNSSIVWSNDTEETTIVGMEEAISGPVTPSIVLFVSAMVVSRIG